MLDTVGRSVGPATGQIKSHRAAGPDDLVFQHITTRASRSKLSLAGNHFPQTGKRVCFEFAPLRFIPVSRNGGTKHLIVNGLHGVVMLAEPQVRQSLCLRGKGSSGGLKVEPEEDAP